MKSLVRGRATLFGEYLMHDGGIGYSFPVPYGLRRDEVLTDSAVGYRSRRDTVAAALSSLASLDASWEPARHVSGCLPLGFGFAGSTVLALLHLNRQFEGDALAELVFASDRRVHGFNPSGVDFAAIKLAAPMLYMDGVGLRAPAVQSTVRFVLVAKERAHDLASVRSRVLQERSVLDQICRDLSAGILNGSGSVLDGLFEYSCLLAGLGVYNSMQAEVIRGALSRGVAAKGIGGLYDKAIMFCGLEADVLREVEFAIANGAMEVGCQDKGSGKCRCIFSWSR